MSIPDWFDAVDLLRLALAAAFESGCSSDQLGELQYRLQLSDLPPDDFQEADDTHEAMLDARRHGVGWGAHIDAVLHRAAPGARPARDPADRAKLRQLCVDALARAGAGAGHVPAIRSAIGGIEIWCDDDGNVWVPTRLDGVHTHGQVLDETSREWVRVTEWATDGQPSRVVRLVQGRSYGHSWAFVAPTAA